MNNLALSLTNAILMRLGATRCKCDLAAGDIEGVGRS